VRVKLICQQRPSWLWVSGACPPSIFRYCNFYWFTERLLKKTMHDWQTNEADNHFCVAKSHYLLTTTAATCAPLQCCMNDEVQAALVIQWQQQKNATETPGDPVQRRLPFKLSIAIRGCLLVILYSCTYMYRPTPTASMLCLHEDPPWFTSRGTNWRLT
jgi:hypothetical protein